MIKSVTQLSIILDKSFNLNYKIHYISELYKLFKLLCNN